VRIDLKKNVGLIYGRILYMHNNFGEILAHWVILMCHWALVNVIYGISFPLTASTRIADRYIPYHHCPLHIL